MTRTSKILVGVGVAILATLALTVWNKRWWISRAKRKWKLERTVVDGVAWIKQPYPPLEEFREDYLLSLQLRRLRELYDTGGLKDPAPTNAPTEQDAPAP